VISELAERLWTVAEVEGRSVSDVVREAVARLVEQRRKDKRFSQLLDENLARHRRLRALLREHGVEPDGGTARTA
jgi:Arc/MetJ-type ribon-helix-helix transcriptional regulator